MQSLVAIKIRDWRSVRRCIIDQLIMAFDRTIISALLELWDRSASAFELTGRTTRDGVSSATQFARVHTLIQARWVIVGVKLRDAKPFIIRLGCLRRACHDDKRSDSQEADDELLQIGALRINAKSLSQTDTPQKGTAPTCNFDLAIV